MDYLRERGCPYMSMTNEQREAIEICKEKIIESFYDFPNPTSIELKDTDVEAIEIVLSLIKEQEKYIKDANDITEEMNGDIMRLIYELKQKDKQIDLMAELVYKRFKAELLLEYGFENEEQLKQYFADLVEKE